LEVSQDSCSLANDFAGIPVIALAQLNQHIPAIAERFYGAPSKKLSVTGVTGTNGKTTIAYQLAQAYAMLSKPAAYIGTLGQGRVGDGAGGAEALETTANTTPDAIQLQRLLAQYYAAGIEQVVMEVSSHALVQNRVSCIDFTQAIFTNLTHDHLDYHHTMEAYAEAKALLFACPSLRAAIINEDDLYATQMKAACYKGLALMTYGIKNTNSQIHLNSYEISMYGMKLDISSPWGRAALQVPALGYFNLYNSLAIFTSLMISGYAMDEVISVMRQLKPAPGRMEIVSQNPCVIVDYAHTPDALKQALITLDALKKKRLILVFGCGGDRDKAKRPIMAEISLSYADEIIITSDNPRTEDPMEIIHDIKSGILSSENSSKVHCIVERKAAIEKAIGLADKDDIVLVAGKGHETYQEIGRERYFFSDQAVIRACIEKNDAEHEV
jgi:UDP-N-acetylmuramoyl-L-alanyl-D-glutamate--2,6-diaminopimelate ligase